MKYYRHPISKELKSTNETEVIFQNTKRFKDLEELDFVSLEQIKKENLLIKLRNENHTEVFGLLYDDKIYLITKKLRNELFNYIEKRNNAVAWTSILNTGVFDLEDIDIKPKNDKFISFLDFVYSSWHNYIDYDDYGFKNCLASFSFKVRIRKVGNKKASKILKFRIVTINDGSYRISRECLISSKYEETSIWLHEFIAEQVEKEIDNIK